MRRPARRRAWRNAGSSRLSASALDGAARARRGSKARSRCGAPGSFGGMPPCHALRPVHQVGEVRGQGGAQAAGGAGSTASGNFAGCAVASATTGRRGILLQQARAPARTPMALWGSSTMPVAAMGLGDLVHHVGLRHRDGVELATGSRQAPPALEREAAGLLQPAISRDRARRRRGRAPRTAAARNSTRSGCPSRARSWARTPRSS